MRRWRNFLASFVGRSNRSADTTHRTSDSTESEVLPLLQASSAPTVSPVNPDHIKGERELMTTMYTADDTARREALQGASAASDWEQAFQEASWLSNHYPVGSLEAEHYSAQARTYAGRIAKPAHEETAPEQPFASLTEQVLASMRAMGANQTHAAPAGVTFNVKIDVELNKPPF